MRNYLCSAEGELNKYKEKLLSEKKRLDEEIKGYRCILDKRESSRVAYIANKNATDTNSQKKTDCEAAPQNLQNKVIGLILRSIMSI